MHWRLGISMILLIWLGLSCEEKRAQVGRVAPDFDLQLVDGSRHQLSDWKGQAIYLNFWTVTCAPCLEDFQNYSAIIHEVNDQADAVFINVCLDADAQQIEAYLLRFDLAIPNIATVTSIDELVSKYNIGAFPHHVLINKEGTVLKNDDRELFQRLRLKD